jgi:hypothetical protein
MEGKEESVLLKERGNLLYSQGNYKEAVEAFTMAIVSALQRSRFGENKRQQCHLLQQPSQELQAVVKIPTDVRRLGASDRER